MSCVNGLRGEVALELREHRLRLRPTFGRLVAAEAEAGSLLGMIERAAAGEVRLADVEALIWHCLDEDSAPARDQFRGWLVERGVSGVLPAYRALLGAAMGGA